MNDYKDLIDKLRNTKSRSKRVLLDFAADVIEQLVKERDAAVTHIPSTCFTCKHFDGLKPTCKKCNWEWRGVQDDRA